MTRALIALLCSTPIFAQSGPDVAEILKTVNRTYSNITEFDLSWTVQYTVSPSQRPGEIVSSVNRSAAKGPLKTFLQQEDTTSSSKASVLLVIDGNGQVESCSPECRSEMVDSHSIRAYRIEAEDIVSFYRRNSTATPLARLLREETIQVNGVDTPCYVVRLPTFDGAVNTWWIDQNRFVVWRDDAEYPGSLDTSTTVWKSIKLNEPVSDELFVFIPPAKPAE